MLTTAGSETTDARRIPFAVRKFGVALPAEATVALAGIGAPPGHEIFVGFALFGLASVRGPANVSLVMILTLDTLRLFFDGRSVCRIAQAAAVLTLAILPGTIRADVPPPRPDGPKFDAKSLGQLGPEHLQLVYCGAKSALAQMPEHRKRLEALSKDPGSSALFDKKGTEQTRKMLAQSEAEAKRIVTDARRLFREKTKKKIADAPCKAYAAAMKPGGSPALEACYARYRASVAEKLDLEIRSRAVASEFRERFRDKLAQDVEQSRKALAGAEAAAKAADAAFDIGKCRFEDGIAYGKP